MIKINKINILVLILNVLTFLLIIFNLIFNYSQQILLLSILFLLYVLTFILLYISTYNHNYQNRKKLINLTKHLDNKYITNDYVLNVNNYLTYLTDEINKYQVENQNFKQAYNILDQAVILLNNNLELLHYNQPAKKLFNIDETFLFEPLDFILKDNELKSLIIDGEDKETFEYKINNNYYLIKLFSSKYENMKNNHIRALISFTNIQASKELSKMKRDFFAHASHELKTPLTAILGHVDLIENNMIDESDFDHIISRIKKQSLNMASLIENMLTLSRLENVINDAKDDINISNQLYNVIDNLSEMIASKEISVIKNIEDDIYFKISEFDISNLFKNLIENAIKYSKENSNVYIDLTLNNDEIIFKVKDEGIGIKDKYQQRIFNRFYRINKGRIEEGTGLGLSIVKHIVLKYNGTVEIDSVENQGSTFIITLKNQSV